MSLPFDSQKLKYFVPLSEISPDNFNELVKNVHVETIAKDQKLFKRGDQDNYSYYLLNGDLEFTDADGNITTLSSKSKECRFPLDQHRPRQKTAISKSDVHYFKIDKNITA